MLHQKFRYTWAFALTLMMASTGLLTPVSHAEQDVQVQPPASNRAISNTLVDLTNRSKQYQTLVTAIKAAELTEVLASKGPFTLFAPNDTAFRKLPPDTLARLLKPENKAALQQVLKYHVVSGVLLSKDLKAGEVATVEGSKLSLKLVSKKLMINNANILKPNVRANNGIAHAIDQVLIPPNLVLK